MHAIIYNNINKIIILEIIIILYRCLIRIKQCTRKLHLILVNVILKD